VHFVKIFSNGLIKAGENDMKCTCCGKHIDEVDCSCKMCTICGWELPVKGFAPVDILEEMER